MLALLALALAVQAVQSTAETQIFPAMLAAILIVRDGVFQARLQVMAERLALRQLVALVLRPALPVHGLFLAQVAAEAALPLALAERAAMVASRAAAVVAEVRR